MIFTAARAKINWTLDILGKRPDGYHIMDMLMQSVELHDDIWLEESIGLTLEAADGSNAYVPLAEHDAMSSQTVRYDSSNLALKAAIALREHTQTGKGARIRLLKRIPTGAGMGGGSADAAAVLIGLNKLWKLALPLDELCRIGLKLGADVPFMLTGGLARVGGIGEQIERLEPAPRAWLAVVQPCGGLSTREVFSAFDACADVAHPRTDEAQSALCRADLRTLAPAMGNVLEAVSIPCRPAIAEAIQVFESVGAVRAMMTGSGSAVYGVFESESLATQALPLIKKKYPDCVLTQTTDCGITCCER